LSAARGPLLALLASRPRDCRTIPTFVAGISQTARATGVIFLETIGGRWYEYIYFFLVPFLPGRRATVLWLFPRGKRLTGAAEPCFRSRGRRGAGRNLNRKLLWGFRSDGTKTNELSRIAKWSQSDSFAPRLRCKTLSTLRSGERQKRSPESVLVLTLALPQVSHRVAVAESELEARTPCVHLS